MLPNIWQFVRSTIFDTCEKLLKVTYYNCNRGGCMTHINPGEVMPTSSDGEPRSSHLELVDTAALHEILKDPDAVSAITWGQQSRLLLKAVADWLEESHEKELLWARLNVLPDRGALGAQKLLEGAPESAVLMYLAELLLARPDLITDVETKNATALFVLGDPHSNTPVPMTALEIQRRYGARYCFGLQAGHYVGAGLALLYEELARTLE